jgi:hypothetical protein
MQSPSSSIARSRVMLPPYSGASSHGTWSQTQATFPLYPFSPCKSSPMPAMVSTSRSRGPFHRQFMTAPSNQSMPLTSFMRVRIVCRRFPAHCRQQRTSCWSNLVRRSSIDSDSSWLTSPVIWTR